MRVRILLQISDKDGVDGAVEEVAVFEKATERPEDVGLSIAESKALLAVLQHKLVEAQAGEWLRRHRCCEACGRKRCLKGTYPVLFRTLYGDVALRSPRLHRCPCRGYSGPATTSPLAALLAGHVAPERLYLETRWASLAPYAAAAGLLADVLPITSGTNAMTLRNHTLRMAECAEAELGEEQASFLNCRSRRAASWSASTAVTCATGKTGPEISS